MGAWICVITNRQRWPYADPSAASLVAGTVKRG
jgi:hypothetical protein